MGLLQPGELAQSNRQPPLPSQEVDAQILDVKELLRLFDVELRGGLTDSTMAEMAPASMAKVELQEKVGAPHCAK